MIDKTIKLRQTVDKPIEASFIGSFIRPANTPFVTTDPKAIRLVKMAGIAIFKKHMNIVLEVGGALYGSNMSDSSCSIFKAVLESFNYSVSLTFF